MKRILKKFKENKGETVMISTFLTLCFVLFIVLCVIEVLSLVVVKQNVDYTARAVTRLLEEEGYVSTEVNTYFEELSTSLGLNGAKLTISNDKPFKHSSEVNSNKCIQYNDTFTITVQSEYDWRALPLRDMTVKSNVSGRSSVYWKE